MTHDVFITGGTGYIGRPLAGELARRGHAVRVLTRPGSEGKIPTGCVAARGDALHHESYAAAVSPADTFVHLVGTSHPAPWQAALFRAVDLASVREAIRAATPAGIRHFVYVSVAQPAPVMRAYLAARAEAESLIRASGLVATVLRPWYVLGPGHRWPLALRPAYWVLERLPSTRETARRLGLVTLAQVVAALVRAVEEPASRLRVVEVPEIASGKADG